MTDIESDLAIARRTITEYEKEFLRLRDEHAAAVMEANHLRQVLGEMIITRAVTV